MFCAPWVTMKIVSNTRNASRVRNKTATRIAAFMFGKITFKSCATSRAVDLCRLQEIPGHLRETGQQQQRQ